MMPRSLCVIGLGLIGGSLLRAADAAGWTVWGTSRPPEDADLAAAAGFQVHDDIEKALRLTEQTDALVVLAVPMPAVEDVLADVHRFAPGCRLTDVVGVKQPVLDAVARRAPGVRYAGGHPMAGAAVSGWAAGSAGLFRDAAWVLICDDDTDREVWLQVAGLALECGAHILPASADEHDEAAARISHLPHVLAAVLAAVGADGGPLALGMAAGSFRDGTRVAGARPDLVAAMCEGNRDALLGAVDDALGRLGAARGSLASTGALASTLRAGHAGREALVAATAATAAAPGGTMTVDLAKPNAMERLREFGRLGGVIRAIDGTRCEVSL